MAEIKTVESARERRLSVLLSEAVDLLDGAIDRGDLRAEWDDVAEAFVEICKKELGE